MLCGWKQWGLASFEMAVRVGDGRAKDDGIKECARSLLTLVKLQSFSDLLEDRFEESRSRPATRSAEHQNPFLPSPMAPKFRLSLILPGRTIELKLTFP